MRVSQKQTVQRNMARALAAGSVLLLSVLVMVVVISADETEPSWTPPLISKGANKSSMSLGDEVTFFINVENSAQPVSPYTRVVPWYQVEVMDVISPVLRIDDVGIVVYQGQPPLVDDVGNTVKVTVSRMDPADFFSLRIDCTLVGPVEEPYLIRNTAKISNYVDTDGRLGKDYFAASTEIGVGYSRVVLPIILRSYLP
jgi:hypothetical protein